MESITHVWQVSGMHCSSCIILIDETVEELDGVTSSTTSLKKKLTTVTLDPTRCDPDQVVAAIQEAGYQATPSAESAATTARPSWFRRDGHEPSDGRRAAERPVARLHVRGVHCRRVRARGTRRTDLPVTSPTHDRLAVRLTVEPHDRYRWISLAAAGLVAVTSAMALFGLPPFELHGPLHWYGIMDPLCGGTRAARYTAMGQWGEAWRYNPLGILTVLFVSLLLLRGVVGVTTGRWATLQVTWTRRARWIAIAVGVILVVLLEIRQQGRAQLLMSDTFTLVDHPPF